MPYDVCASNWPRQNVTAYAAIKIIYGSVNHIFICLHWGEMTCKLLSWVVLATINELHIIGGMEWHTFGKWIIIMWICIWVSSYFLIPARKLLPILLIGTNFFFEDFAILLWHIFFPHPSININHTWNMNLLGFLFKHGYTTWNTHIRTCSSFYLFYFHSQVIRKRGCV